MIFGKRYRALPTARRRLALEQNLRLEHWEHRSVFAGLAPVAVNEVYEAVLQRDRGTPSWMRPASRMCWPPSLTG